MLACEGAMTHFHRGEEASVHPTPPIITPSVATTRGPGRKDNKGSLAIIFQEKLIIQIN